MHGNDCEWLQLERITETDTARSRLDFPPSARNTLWISFDLYGSGSSGTDSCYIDDAPLSGFSGAPNAMDVGLL